VLLKQLVAAREDTHLAVLGDHDLSSAFAAAFEYAVHDSPLNPETAPSSTTIY
jgi:hypothetical protein